MATSYTASGSSAHLFSHAEVTIPIAHQFYYSEAWVLSIYLPTEEDLPKATPDSDLPEPTYQTSKNNEFTFGCSDQSYLEKKEYCTTVDHLLTQPTRTGLPCEICSATIPANLEFNGIIRNNTKSPTKAGL